MMREDIAGTSRVYRPKLILQKVEALFSLPLDGPTRGGELLRPIFFKGSVGYDIIWGLT
jgi:hypothetical protein